MNRAIALYRSSVGKKAIMAVTGLIGVGFVIGHMIGNLQIFLPDAEAKLQAYALFLRKAGDGGLLWVVRFVLLAAVGLHIFAAYQLTITSWNARPSGYKKWIPTGSDYASRTMRWSGPILLFFIVYHLLDLTLGTVNPSFEHLNPYRNMIASFQILPVAALYVIAQLALGFHLFHGIWSMFQSLGVNHPEYNGMLKTISVVITVVVVTGNISIPVAVLTGFVS